MGLAIKKGMPPLIMTRDRRLFEFVSIGDDGVITTGAEITPEQVVTEKQVIKMKKERNWRRSVSKNLFRYIASKRSKKYSGWFIGRKHKGREK